MSTGPTYHRAFRADMQRTGPRTLSGRLVPWDEVADVADELPDGSLDIYKEGFRAGSFPQARSKERGVLTRISLVHRHEGGIGYLGPFVALREEDDGLYGDANVLRSRADDVEDLLAAGVDKLSVEFRLPAANSTEVDDDGVRWRTKVHLDQVALEPKGAYDRAEVLAYRAALEQQANEADQAAARQREQAAKALAEAEARRKRWDELTSRADVERARQEELVRQYGMTQPGGLRPTLAEAHDRINHLRG